MIWYAKQQFAYFKVYVINVLQWFKCIELSILGTFAKVLRRVITNCVNLSNISAPTGRIFEIHSEIYPPLRHKFLVHPTSSETAGSHWMLPAIVSFSSRWDAALALTLLMMSSLPLLMCSFTPTRHPAATTFISHWNLSSSSSISLSPLLGTDHLV